MLPLSQDTVHRMSSHQADTLGVFQATLNLINHISSTEQVCVCVSVCVCVCHSLSLYACVCECFSLYLSVCVSVSLSLSVCVSVSLSLSVCVCVCVVCLLKYFNVYEIVTVWV